jgi:biotin-dependent carboxylase-like uncharacterized protein
VLHAGAQTTVQDLGRPGWAHLGVPRSGALDQPAHRLANRLVGNAEDAATLECLGGGLRIRLEAATTVAVTGARVAVSVDGRSRNWCAPVSAPAGSELALGPVEEGLRCYVAFSGGVQVEEELASRSTDLLSGLGPAPLGDGDCLPLGTVQGDPAPLDVPPRPARGGRLRLVPGPRDDWFEEGALAALRDASYVVSSSSNRIGLRLEGPKIARRRDEELPSEPMVLGAVQVPPSGQPVVFLHDHPTTGGYPVLGVVVAEDLARCAQLRPGDEVRFVVEPQG